MWDPHGFGSCAHLHATETSCFGFWFGSILRDTMGLGFHVLQNLPSSASGLALPDTMGLHELHHSKNN